MSKVKVTVSFHCQKCDKVVSAPFDDAVHATVGNSGYGEFKGWTSHEVNCPTCHKYYDIEVE